MPSIHSGSGIRCSRRMRHRHGAVHPRRLVVAVPQSRGRTAERDDVASSARCIFTFGELLWAEFWERFPLRFSLTEGDIGGSPYFLGRAEHVNRHSGGRRTFPDGRGPDVFREHIYSCFISEKVGVEEHGLVQRRQRVLGVRLPALRQQLADRARGCPETWALDDAVINKITHENAMAAYSFDPFKHIPKEHARAGYLRCKRPRSTSSHMWGTRQVSGTVTRGRG